MLVRGRKYFEKRVLKIEIRQQREEKAALCRNKALLFVCLNYVFKIHEKRFSVVTRVFVKNVTL